MNNTPKKYLPQIAGAVSAIIFGFSFLFTKDALEHLAPFHLMGLRFLTAAAAMTLLALTGIIKVNLRWGTVKSLLPVAFFQPVLYFIFETAGVKITSASESGIVIALVPVAITVLAVLMLKERLSLLQWVCVFVSVFGVLLIIISGSGAEGGSNKAGVLFLLGAVVSAGLYNVFSRKVSAVFSPAEVTFVMMWVGAIVFNIIGVITEAGQGRLADYFSAAAGGSVLVDLLYLGVISSIGAFFSLNYSLSRMEASKAAVFINITPIVTVLAGIFLRGERLFLLQCVGAVIVLAGVWGVNRRGRK